MNQQINKSQIKLKELFDEFSAFGNMSDRQKQELFTKLEGAITLNIVGRLFDQMSEKDKVFIGENEFKTNEDFLKFLSGTVPKKNFRIVAALAIEEVVNKFLDKI